MMQHSIKFVSASKENPSLLIMDNNENHPSVEALDLAKSSGVTVLTLHPHTTAKVQPLDVGINGPFKCFYNALIDSWLLRNPGKPLTIYNIAECVGHAFMNVMTPVNITKGFMKCGVFDANIFTEEDFLPSSVTDRPDAEKAETKTAALARDEDTISPGPSAPNKEDDYTVEDVTNTNNKTPPIIECVAPDPIEPSSSLRDPQLPVPTSSKFISPNEFMPPLKAKPRILKSRRTPGRSLIATDIPEKD